MFLKNVTTVLRCYRGAIRSVLSKRYIESKTHFVAPLEPNEDLLGPKGGIRLGPIIQKDQISYTKKVDRKVDVK